MSEAAANKPISARTGRRDGACYAALDLGTNNCRLLIATPTGRSFRILEAFSRIVRLGEGLSKTGRLDPGAMERTFCAPRRLRGEDRAARRGHRTGGGDPGLPPGRQRRGVRRRSGAPHGPGAAGHLAAGRGAPFGHRLSEPDRPRRRCCPGGGRRRRFDGVVMGGPARRGAPPPRRPAGPRPAADPGLGVDTHRRRHPGRALPRDRARLRDVVPGHGRAHEARDRTLSSRRAPATDLRLRASASDRHLRRHNQPGGAAPGPEALRPHPGRWPVAHSCGLSRGGGTADAAQPGGACCRALHRSPIAPTWCSRAPRSCRPCRSSGLASVSVSPTAGSAKAYC